MILNSEATGHLVKDVLNGRTTKLSPKNEFSSANLIINVSKNFHMDAAFFKNSFFILDGRTRHSTHEICSYAIPKFLQYFTRVVT